jgi:hypothetical protein
MAILFDKMNGHTIMTAFPHVDLAPHLCLSFTGHVASILFHSTATVRILDVKPTLGTWCATDMLPSPPKKGGRVLLEKLIVT